MGRCALALCAAFTCTLACKGSPPGEQAAPKHDAATVAHVDEALAAIVATCAEAIGTVDARRKGQPQWDPARVGTTFRERDWVRTGEASFARLRFSERGSIDLPEHTTILVDSAITIESGSLVAVAEGGVPMRVRAADGSEAQILAADGAQPAELRLTPSSGSGLEIAVTKGTVTVVTREGAQAVAAGQASDLINHRAGAIIQLLGFPLSISPAIDARLQLVAGRPITLAWRPVPRAVRYRVQVARDTEFRVRVLDTDVIPTKAAFTPAEPNAYLWRVAAIDDAGRLGEFGFARRMFVELDAPRELLVAPAAGARIGFANKQPRVSFSWRAAADVEQYRLVVSRGADLNANPVVSITTSAVRMDVTTLREGRYRWGVYAIHEGRETPIFLAPRALTIRRQRVKAHTEKLWQDNR